MSLKYFPSMLGALLLLVVVPALAGKAEAYKIKSEDAALGEFDVETGQFGQVLNSKAATIFISSFCDAFSPEMGKGTWVQDNGGIRVLFPDNEIWFRGYEADFDNECSFLNLRSSLEEMD